MRALHNRFLCAAAVALALVTAHAQAANVLWTGSTGNVWNTSAANWSGNATKYTSGDIVQFGDTGGGNLPFRLLRDKKSKFIAPSPAPGHHLNGR